MSLKTLNNVSELTKEWLADFYFESLENRETKKLIHPSLFRSGGPTPVTPSVHEAAMDVATWYGGVRSICLGLDPGVDLPPIKEMIEYITQNKFERVKTAIAA